MRSTRIRPIFGGQLTYSSGPWEEVDWRPFDVVGIDLYRDTENAATFVDDVRALHRHGKPVVITEFGCCAFRGAEDLGGGGFLVVDWTAAPPIVEPGLVRDEQVQARYIDELLDVFTAERVHGAFVYDFIEPGNPYSPDPRFDLDMAGFGVVKCYPSARARLRGDGTLRTEGRLRDDRHTLRMRVRRSARLPRRDATCALHVRTCLTWRESRPDCAIRTASCPAESEPRSTRVTTNVPTVAVKSSAHERGADDRRSGAVSPVARWGGRGGSAAPRRSAGDSPLGRGSGRARPPTTAATRWEVPGPHDRCGSGRTSCPSGGRHLTPMRSGRGPASRRRRRTGLSAPTRRRWPATSWSCAQLRSSTACTGGSPSTTSSG